MDHGRTITVASRNAKKAGELRALMGAGWAVRGLEELPGAPEVEEDGATFVENAIKKATEVSMHVDGLVLAGSIGLMTLINLRYYYFWRRDSRDGAGTR